MSTFPLNPGAGLQAGSWLRPPGPPKAAAFDPPPRPPNGSSYDPPPNPPRPAGFDPAPNPPQPSAFDPAPNPPRRGGFDPAPNPPEAPLRSGGVDPHWAHVDPQALVARALWRTRNKVNPDGDERIQRLLTGLPERPIERWGSEFRVRAIAADLAWRWRVDGNRLFRHEPSKSGFSSMLTLQLDGLADYDQQVDKVLRAAVEREERLPEILVQVDDLWTFFTAISGLDLTQAPRTAELLDIAWSWAKGVVMALKHGVAGDGMGNDPSLRPYQRNRLVQPIIPTPTHSSYPSGHASMAFLSSELLYALLRDASPAIDRLARRIAFNRTVAGLHFPVDNAAGAALGRQMAALFIGWATGKAPLRSVHFTPKPGEMDELKEAQGREAFAGRPTAIVQSKLLSEQWKAACAELKRLDR